MEIGRPGVAFLIIVGATALVELYGLQDGVLYLFALLGIILLYKIITGHMR
jgi:hypothetical protein